MQENVSAPEIDLLERRGVYAELIRLSGLSAKTVKKVLEDIKNGTDNANYSSAQKVKDAIKVISGPDAHLKSE